MVVSAVDGGGTGGRWHPHTPQFSGTPSVAFHRTGVCSGRLLRSIEPVIEVNGGPDIRIGLMVNLIDEMRWGK